VGADILAAEAGLERGARVVLGLALPPEEFEQRSVVLPGTDWQARFRALLDRSEVRRAYGIVVAIGFSTRPELASRRLITPPG